MQGFNKYYPPDFDPSKTHTLNDYHGKHALGDRARKIDKGILIVRFELPFNIWCGTCGAHIGAGVRYNAEKKKVGNYYSTPIFGFRCKCHLCSGWFEIRTDPKNSAYIVFEGASRKQEDWDPEENGGYAVQDTEKPSTADPDPFSQLEKTTTQLALTKTREERLEELYDLSNSKNADPYTLSSNLRKSFRTAKRARLAIEDVDNSISDKYGLSGKVKLIEMGLEDGKSEWKSARDEVDRREVGRKQVDLIKNRVTDEPSSGKDSLRRKLVLETQKIRDPFISPNASTSSPKLSLPPPRTIKKQPSRRSVPEPTVSLIDGYGSD